MPNIYHSKICSYEGACLRRRPGCTSLKHYSYHDPSNYVYAQMWYLLVRYSQATMRKAHLFSKSDVRLKCRHVVAQRMLDIHSRACVRWPAVSPLKHYNRLGDLLEFVLGRCYCDGSGRLNSMLHIISDIAFWVRDIEHAVWHNQLTQPRSRIAADTWAKGVYWIYEMQRHKEVQCHNYCYSGEEEKFDKWASEMNYCFQWIHLSSLYTERRDLLHHSSFNVESTLRLVWSWIHVNFFSAYDFLATVCSCTD